MVPRRLIALLAITAAPAFAASLDAEIGKRMFERSWVTAPSSTRSNDGLGPLYNARSCVSCHARALGPLDEDAVPPGTVLRIGNANGGGDPVYGRQIQTRAVPGHTPEANPDIAWANREAGLRAATIRLSLNYGPLSADTKIGLRRAPVLDGIGLLAQVPDSEILRRADPDDKNADGIAGRAALFDRDGKKTLGRFGWKASEPDLAAQTAKAFSLDIGMSTSLRPDPSGDCTEAETQCRNGPHGGTAADPEIPDAMMGEIIAYLNALPAPKSENGQGPGAALFASTGCDACHADLHTDDGRRVRAYTDLLLHRMGEGLNDGIEEGAAEPGEWRTAPLWHMAKSLETGGLLHDGRARSIDEAIEWHGGEGSPARERFRALAPTDKAALAAFVRGL